VTPVNQGWSLSDFSMFLEPDALGINAARQQHLASLGLDLDNKLVLEVGAGIGLHTGFFEERGCDILATDGNPLNVAEMLRRFPQRKLGVLDLDRPAGLDALGMFDIVYCYGALYHLRDPEGALARLAAICSGQILLETIVMPGEFSELHRVAEPLTPNQGLHGSGTRPTRPWVMSALRRHFGHAYTTLDQPDFPDFITDWQLIAHPGNLRAIFVGSKVPLALPTLTANLVKRHRNAPTSLKAPVPRRVWIDVGAYQGEVTRQAAIDDPQLVVHAFEPLPELCEGLAATADNYLVHAMAVSDQDGLAPFRINRFAAASSLLSLDETARRAWIDGDLLVEEREIIVPTVRLDTFMDEAEIAEVEFLKIDAQGADFAVIRSAGDRLRDIRQIKLEVAVTPQQLYRGAADKATIVGYLEDRGFSLADTEPQSHGQEENLTFMRR
jgi:FkbM family methyltransferase